MIEQTPFPIGARVRLRHVWDFLTLRADAATVVGPGDAPGLVVIRLDRPAVCRFEEEDEHLVSEIAEAADNLEVIAG